MYKLLQLIETVKVNHAFKESPNTQFTQKDKETFFNIIKDAKCFVLSPTKDHDTPIELEEKKLENYDLPYPTVSIEMCSDFSLSMPRDNDPVQAYTECIVLHETAPKEYLAYVLTREGNKDVFYCFEMALQKETAFASLLEYLLDRINSNKLGIEKVNHKLKLGTGKNKSFHKIKEIIHVAPKKEYLDYSSRFCKEINWSHKWLVRGHWRTISGIGKNRAGEYNVDGHTWVTHHEKGQGKLIPKTYLVK